ncbi:MAG: hypothetical protein ACK559_12805, partial [bacterium]
APRRNSGHTGSPHSLTCGKNSHVLSTTLMPGQAGLWVASLSWFSSSTERGKTRMVVLMRGPSLPFDVLSRWQTARKAVSPTPLSCHSVGTIALPSCRKPCW